MAELEGAPHAYVGEALERDAPTLDQTMSDEKLTALIEGLAADLEILARGIRTGPRDMRQLISLDNIADALDEPMRLEEMRKEMKRQASLPELGI